MLLTPSMVGAETDHKKRYDPSIPAVVCKEKYKKSIGDIIREILGRKRIEKLEMEFYDTPPLKLDLDNTVPIPVPSLYKLKNLA